MPIDRLLWRASITKTHVPEWPCPACDKPSLELVKESFLIIHDRESERFEPPECIPEAMSGRFVCLLRCRRCIESCAVSGNFDINQDYDGYYAQGYPKSITPPPSMILIPTACPPLVRSEVITAFSLYWIDLPACLNRIRNALELVLDDLKVPKFTVNRARGKKNRLQLHDRIVKLERKKPKLKAICERMMAVKYLGNAGSHPGEKVEFDDVFDGFDILEWVLQDMYSAHMGRLFKAVKQINRKKGPRGSGR